MKAIAIDDEPIALDIVTAHASKVPFLELKEVFTDAFKAMEYLQRESVDLIFLDIKMPDISGIDFFNSLGKKPLVIFTTAYSEHAVTSFELDAVDYLLKPFSLSRFLKACNKAFELYTYRTKGPATDHLFIKTGYELVKVFFSDILYVEATGNYVTFFLEGKNVLSRSTFLEAISLLPPEQFVRIHRSFLVAKSRVTKLERQQIWINTLSLPVGDAYSRQLPKLFKAP
ncbi:MAG TPA: LytTR family DNA-binding domain-containing protein [Flavisolibacter sp.]